MTQKSGVIFMYSRLKGKLKEHGVRGEELAKVWNCTLPTVYYKLNGKTIITVDELQAVALNFKFSESEILYILFGPTT